MSRTRTIAATLLFGLLLIATDRLSAQPKKVLTHADYDAWKNSTGVTLSPDGKYVAYTVSPLDGSDAEVIVRQPPPPPREEVRISPPSQVDVWVPGYWSWSTNEWVWVQGRWQRPPERRATWVPGQWTQRGEQGELWAWRPGHWE